MHTGSHVLQTSVRRWCDVDSGKFNLLKRITLTGRFCLVPRIGRFNAMMTNRSYSCYRPQAKLREGYAFTRVCPSTLGGGGNIPYSQPGGPYALKPYAPSPDHNPPPQHSKASVVKMVQSGRYVSYRNGFFLVF